MTRICAAIAAALVVLGLKGYYAAARSDDLWWVLRPTTGLVELMTGATFTVSPGEGYFSRDHLFLIEKSCAGINFMAAAFVMLVFARFYQIGSAVSTARSLGVCLLVSYGAAVGVNAVRIAIAMWLAAQPPGRFAFSAADVHRVEGVAVYFGGLMILYGLVQWQVAVADAFRRAALPLFSYYAVTLGLPLANGAAQSGARFVDHALVVLIVPLLVIVLACAGHRTAHALARVFRRVVGDPVVESPQPAHSVRSAITGSIVVARRAGNHEANSATSSKITDTAP